LGRPAAAHATATPSGTPRPTSADGRKASILKQANPADATHATHHKDTAGGSVKKSVTVEKGPPQTREIPANTQPKPVHAARNKINNGKPTKPTGLAKIRRDKSTSDDTVSEAMKRKVVRKPFDPKFDHKIKPQTHNENGEHLTAVGHRAVADAIKEDNKKRQHS